MYSEAVRIFDEAFEAKMAVAVEDKGKRRKLLEASLVPELVIAATANDTLVGLVGLKTTEGSFTGNMSLRGLFQHLGLLASVRAAIIFSIYENETASQALWISAIAVSSTWRGKGVGTHLIDFVKTFAQEKGYSTIKLAVIDSNEKAKLLYEREGFVVEHTQKFAHLRWLLGFRGASTMTFTVNK